MQDKANLRKEQRLLKRVKTWQLVIVFILLCFVAATLLRLNNIGMLQRRESVLNADRAGDPDATTDALIQLQQYSAGHMNASTGAFYLEGAYKAAVKTAYEKAASYEDPNGNVNVKADAICKPKFTQYSQAYTDCFAAALKDFPAAPNPTEAIKFPDPNLYRYSYLSPRWSLDFAGLAVVVCILVALLIIARLVTLGMLYLLLRRRYKSV